MVIADIVITQCRQNLCGNTTVCGDTDADNGRLHKPEQTGDRVAGMQLINIFQYHIRLLFITVKGKIDLAVMG